MKQTYVNFKSRTGYETWCSLNLSVKSFWTRRGRSCDTWGCPRHRRGSRQWRPQSAAAAQTRITCWPGARSKQPIKMVGIWPGPNNKYFPHFKSSLRKCDHFAELSDHRDRNVVSPVNQWSGTWHNEQNTGLLSKLFKTLHLSLTALSKSLCFENVI